MKNIEISKAELELFVKIASEITSSELFLREKNYIAHGTTTVFDHSIRVAFLSYIYALRRKYLLDYRALIRGALLHDYYLYDWHKNKPFTFHGLKHNKIACNNAIKDFNINRLEQKIILTHMFPLTIFHIPLCREAMIVCKMDKLAAMQEHREFRRMVYEHSI